VRRALANLFILLFLAANVMAAVRGIEDFPLTAAVMFARDIGPERPLYTLHWRITDDEGAQTEVVLRSLWLEPRHFFLHVYLPDITDSPYHGRDRGPDSPGAFDARMSRWFSVMVERWIRRTSGAPVRVDLLVRPHPRAGAQAATAEAEITIGSFDVADGRFRRRAADGATP